MPTLTDYRSFDGLHYETGSVHNLLAHQGLKMPHTQAPPSEALLLGLSGGITFGYFSFAYKGLDPFVALLTRNTFNPLETMLAILRSDRPLVIAPEGGRSHVTAMQRAKPGIGYLIEHAQPVVVPVGLVGTTDDFWQRARRGERPALEMRIGRPIHFAAVSESGSARRAARQANADLVMRHIAGLLPEEYHGVYAGQAILP